MNGTILNFFAVTVIQEVICQAGPCEMQVAVRLNERNKRSCNALCTFSEIISEDEYI